MMQSNQRQRLSITKEATMLWTFAMILLLLWALGLVASFTLGGYLHILVGIAVLLLLMQILQTRGRRSGGLPRGGR
jgi:uncharacterized membrane protein